MTLTDLEDQEKKLMAEIVRRRQLGGYNTDAPTLELLAVALYELTRHLREQATGAKPARKKADDPN